MTKSFHVEDCRRLDAQKAEFGVRQLSGALAVGDRFECNAGNGRSARFHIESVTDDGRLTRIVCSGPIAFDEQFLHFTVSTRPFPAQRDDLPAPVRLPDGAKEGEEDLKRWVDDWEFYHPLQRALLLCVARGPQKPERIAESLGVSVQDVTSALRGLTGIVLQDCSTQEVWLS